MHHMRVHSHLNTPAQVEHIASAQYGYFTRAQAHEAGVKDFELTRSKTYGQIVRISHGVYRIVGAPVDRHEDLRVAWLRLNPEMSPRERTRSPMLWVSHRSAARLHDLGVFLADTPEFIATRKLQPRFPARIRVRSKGLDRDEWVIRDGFAVTSVLRTMQDLAGEAIDSGHLGQFVSDAIRTGAASKRELQEAVDPHLRIDALLAMAEK